MERVLEPERRNLLLVRSYVVGTQSPRVALCVDILPTNLRSESTVLRLEKKPCGGSPDEAGIGDSSLPFAADLLESSRMI